MSPGEFTFQWGGAIFVILTMFILVCPVNALSIQGISDQPVKEAEVGDISIGYREFGSGQPLIMIMGYSGAMDIWDPVLLQNLSSQYRVIIFDNRGVGTTSDSGAEYSIPLFARDTAGLMDALHISRADVLGWSMGGNIALELAVDYPEKVKSLVLYAADAGGEQAILMTPDVQKQLTNGSGTDRERGERLLGLILPAPWLKEHPDPRTYFPDATEPVNNTTIIDQIHALSTWKGVFDRLHTIRCPTLLITGDQDRIIPPENTERIAGEIPSAKVIQIPGGGHGVMYQDPELFAGYVLDFLNNSTYQE